MQPTLRDKQILLSTIPFQIDRRDIVLIERGDRLIIKRVIGVPGDTVYIHDYHVYVNGKIVDLFITEFAGLAHEPITLGADEYFVLGDNRGNSLDSRYSSVGVINKEQILWKVIILKQSAYDKYLS